MLSERYNINDTEAVVSEFRELLGDLRVIWEDTDYRIEKEDCKNQEEYEKLKGICNILGRHIFAMAEEFDELSEL